MSLFFGRTLGSYCSSFLSQYMYSSESREKSMRELQFRGVGLVLYYWKEREERNKYRCALFSEQIG